MDRAEKAGLVAELNKVLSETGVVVVTLNKGMTVAQATELRVKMREAGASYKVAKNRLARLALDGTSYTSLDGLLVGPTGLATSVDPVAAAQVAVEFAKKNDKFELVGGAMGDTGLDVNGVQELAELPSLAELRAKIVGLINAPATTVSLLATAPASTLPRLLPPSTHATAPP